MTADGSELHYETIGSLAPRLESGELSPVELTEAILDRIDEVEPTLQAYYSVLRDDVLDAAKAAEAEIAAGQYRGPLHGIPVAVKDTFWAGPTTAGSAARADFVAPADATVVERLREAGALLVGKLATYEFGLGIPNGRAALPPARNPWDPTIEPGGSSTGAGAAVAAGAVVAAVGTDSGGSVRVPAFGCGIVGMKPTHGLVSRANTFPLAWSLEAVGPLTRSVEDAALVLGAIAGHDHRDPATVPAPAPRLPQAVPEGFAGVRLGVPKALFDSNCDPAIRQGFDAAMAEFEALGASVQTVTTPAMREIFTTFWSIMIGEIAAYHLPQLRSDPSVLGREVRLQSVMGLLMDATHYVDAQRARQTIRSAILDQLAGLDALALPTVGMMCGPIPDEPYGLGIMQLDEVPFYTMLASLAGTPAIALPCGLTDTELPVGFQLMGRPFDDSNLLRLAHAYEQATGHGARRPPL